MCIPAGLTALYLASAAPALGQTVRAGDVAFANSSAPAAQAPFLTGLALLHDFDTAPPSWRSSGPRRPI
jgi:hypothetical protein